MSSFEWNKIFAAFLLAALVGWLGWFVSEKVVRPTELEKPAYVVEIAEAAPADAAAAPAGPEDISPLLVTANVERGATLSRACAACHSFDKGGINKVGPNMWDIVGSPHAHIDGFAYSEAMKAKHNEPWSYAALNEFLYNPRAAIPGTKMAYAGMRKTQDRADLIAWLRTLSDSPKPLP